jgi:serine protease inhibitor
LPYRGYAEEIDGARFGMYIILPNPNHDFNTAVRLLTLTKLDNCNYAMTRKFGEIKMPRFSNEFQYELLEPLKNLGIEAAFSPFEADFSEMINNKVYISSVLHKTSIRVNEKGTEAIAKTAIMVEEQCAVEFDESLPFKFIANRPFIFFIRDNQTKSILFMGIIRNPD